jgi:putative oxidoreductase
MLGIDKKTDSNMKDLGLLALRLTAGGLIAGHGAQKLFGVFGGYGLEGTAGWIESMGLKPGKTWAQLAGASEFGSGLLTALGFLGPLGPISTLAPMTIAWATVHAGKPIWVTSGGAELPLTNMAIATALALIGPGRYSMDELLGIDVPAPIVALSAAGVAAGVGAALWMQRSHASSQADVVASPEEPATVFTDETPEEPLLERAAGA